MPREAPAVAKPARRKHPVTRAEQGCCGAFGRGGWAGHGSRHGGQLEGVKRRPGGGPGDWETETRTPRAEVKRRLEPGETFTWQPVQSSSPQGVQSRLPDSGRVPSGRSL